MRTVLALACLALPLAAWGDDPLETPQPEPGDDVYLRGNVSRRGTIWPDGTFVPVLSELSCEKFGGGLYRFPIGCGWERCYEFRGGRVVAGSCLPDPGEPLFCRGSAFVPELGSVVRPLAEVTRNGVTDQPIWNTHAIRFWTPEREKQYPEGLPQAPKPPDAGTPAGYDWVPVSKRKAEERPYDVRIAGGVAEAGFLRDDGEFIPDYAVLPFNWTGVWRALPALARRGKPNLYTLPRDGAKAEDVYEFRGGRLIRGVLRDTGAFVPDLGDSVTAFGKYDPADKRRVYNLPGTLTRTAARR